MSTELVIPSNHLILCCPLLFPPSVFPSIRVFSSESVLRIRWPKYWSFSFSIRPSNEYSGLISFMMDWLDLLAVHGLSRVFSNTTVQKHQFFGAQLSHPFMTTGKTIALTRWTFVDLLISFAILYEWGSPCLKKITTVTSKITDCRYTTTNIIIMKKVWGFPGGSVVKNQPANAENTGLVPGLGSCHMLRSN